MSEEEVKSLEEAPKKRRSKKAAPKNVITGKVKSDDFSSSISEIEKDSMVSSDEVADILVSTMEQAYLEWSYPGLYKDKDSDDPAKDLIKAKVVFDDAYDKFDIYDIKTVTNEDDIVDDAYQISPEDAAEYKKDAKLGDIVEIPFDVTKLDKTYVRRVKQLFQSKLKEASKEAILTVYKDQIGELIEGTCIKAENDNYEISFGKAEGFLRKNAHNLLPNDHFSVGEKVLVHLSDVSDRSNPPSLVISRTSDKFLEKLLERYVPELQSGTVVIRGLAREAGKRTKIFVESKDPNVDPVGTCVGPESTRIRSALNELKGEKIDIAKYHQNKALQIIEAMKPATVIGLTCPDDFFDSNVHYEELEADKDYEYPKITAVVKNGNQGVAIGSQGVNVRLASRLTKCTISVLHSDDAISSGLKYMMVADIEKLVGENTPAPAPLSSDEASQEGDLEEETVKDEEVIPNEAPIAEEAKPVEEAKPAEEVKPVEEVKPAPEAKPVEEAKPAEEVKPVEEKKPEVDLIKEAKQSQPVEHIEIHNKPKISLEELEEALSQKKGPSETRSHKRYKKDEKKEEEAPSEASKVQAMPIYTEAELREMEEAEKDQNDNSNTDMDDEESEELDEAYDEYYDDNK